MSHMLLVRSYSLVTLGKNVQRFTTSSVSVQHLKEAAVDNARPITDIPGPRSYPLLGSIPSLIMDKDFDIKRIHKFWMSAVDRYGPIVRVVNPGMADMVGVVSVEDCEKINRLTVNDPRRTPLGSLKHLRDNWTDNYFEKRAGILTENGEEWWRVRSRVQTTLLKPMVVSEYLAEMDDIALTFMDRIQELQDKHGEMPDNFQEELYKWALESVGVVALDRRLGCLGAREGSVEAMRGEELITVVNNIFASMAITEMKTQIWRLIPTPSYRKLQRNHDRLLKLVSEQVAQTVAFLEQQSDGKVAGERKNSVIQRLLSTPGLTEKDVITFIMDLVFAGIDTTSHTMAFCFYLLARNPQVQEKLQEEVDKVIHGHQGPLTKNHLDSLSYLKAVIKETFRIFPLTFAFVRILTEDIVLQGYHLPAGTNVLSLNTLMGWDSSVYPRADEFLPERWMRDRPHGKIHPFATIPFGAGPRMCVGRRVAEKEMYTLLTRVTQRFKIEYHHEDIEQLSGLVFYPSRPLRFSFQSRQS